MNEHVQHDRDFKNLRHFAARYAWENQEKLTPLAKITWAEWFRRKFGMTLGEYAAWYDKEKRK